MTVRMKTAVLTLVLGVAAVGAFACSSSTSSTSSTPPGSTTTDKVTVHVSAASGGTVADKSGKASLAIPGGALAQDTDITLATSAAVTGTVSDVLEFGPDGLQFVKPATLTVKAEASLAPPGKSLAIAMQQADGSWKPVEGSKFENGQVTAPVAHFTKFSIVLVDGNAVLVPPSTCADAIANFKPCGGNPQGTWTFADFCANAQTLGADPFNGKCPSFVAGVELSNDRTVTFTASTVDTSTGTETTKFTYSFAKTCTIGDAGVTDCASLSKNGTTCADKAGASEPSCECTKTETKQKAANSEPYTINGNLFTSGSGTGGETYEFCVNGNLLSAHQVQPDGGMAGILYVLQKK